MTWELRVQILHGVVLCGAHGTSTFNSFKHYHMVKQKKRIRRVSDLGIHFFSSYDAVLTGSPVPTMHRWSQFGGQRCASNVHERGWTGVDVGEGGMSYEARMQALRACVFR